MLDGINAGFEEYWRKWQALVAARQDKAFFEGLRPTAVGWKVADRAEYDKLVAELHDQADTIIEVWMNGRWIAKIHLRDMQLEHGIELIKIMQRRPGSTDATGLDHIDFYTPTALAHNAQVLTAEHGLQWSQENNDILPGYDWLSLWFESTEAKIKSNTVLDIVGQELEELNKGIIGA